jgi:SAM-dependent methyltransferase
VQRRNRSRGLVNHQVRSVVRRIARTPLVTGLKTLRPGLRSARSAFEAAGVDPGWLGEEWIAAYQRRYAPRARYAYDIATSARRGRERASEMMRWLPARKIHRTLEIGCRDGMVSAALQDLGNAAVAIDYRATAFEDRARHAGVKLLEMDARDLRFADGTFDLAFSYNSFEHFAQPEKVLCELIRVLRPGGYLHIDFGPLYMSPLGAHLYRQITIPYCQLLFPKEALQHFADNRGLGVLDFGGGVNGYTAEDFRNLWARHADQLRAVKYYEIPNTSHVDLIQRHPTCFKSKTNLFDNLIVSQIVALFQKN